MRPAAIEQQQWARQLASVSAMGQKPKAAWQMREWKRESQGEEQPTQLQLGAELTGSGSGGDDDGDDGRG